MHIYHYNAIENTQGSESPKCMQAMDCIYKASCAYELQTALRKIWLASFDDTAEYFDFFYKRNVLTGQAQLFYAVNGEPDNIKSEITGAAYLLGPCTFNYNNTACKAYYGYAFAVLPEYRSKGVYTALSYKFREWARSKAAGIFIYPANVKLLKYYIKTGACRNFRTHTIKISSEAIRAIFEKYNARNLYPCDAALYQRIRNSHMENTESIIWDARSISYAIEENISCGGFCKIITVSGEDHIIFGCEISEKAASQYTIIKETSLPDRFFKENCRTGDFEIINIDLASYDIPYVSASNPVTAGLLLD